MAGTSPLVCRNGELTERSMTRPGTMLGLEGSRCGWYLIVSTTGTLLQLNPPGQPSGMVYPDQIGAVNGFKAANWHVCAEG
jgi:hypothetical protein